MDLVLVVIKCTVRAETPLVLILAPLTVASASTRANSQCFSIASIVTQCAELNFSECVTNVTFFG